MASSKQVITVYYCITSLYTLSVSVIWGINTLFLMDAGLDIFQVMLVNALFTAGMVIFEVPTGVVADTIGRKVSFLLCISVLFVTTIFYVVAAGLGWGVWAFAGISVLIGLGFTFFTGAVEAWLVDALDHTGYEEPYDRIFARGQALFSGAMLIGTVGGGNPHSHEGPGFRGPTPERFHFQS
jgi:MFS family permease